MSQQLISIACEGPHDVAFVNRILKAQGFETSEKTKIGDYPYPMGKFFENTARRSDFSQLNFSEARQVPLPTHALTKDAVSIFLYALGGDSKKAERATLLKELESFIPEDDQEIRVLPQGTSITLAFLFDADDKGVKSRLEQITKEVAESLEVDHAEVALQENGDCCEIKGLRVSCLVLTDESSETGKLEDLLVPLMRDGNETIFDAAEKFLAEHFDKTRTKFLRIRNEEGMLVEKRGSSKDFDHRKSLIGVVAQLQISGKPNAACINRTDYLNKDKLTTHECCVGIREFISRITAS